MNALDAPFEGLLRIGAFAERLGVSQAVLRAWESRYGLFTPVRTPGGFRLYSPADEARGRRMLGHLRRGLAARESAALTLRTATVPVPALSGLIDAWSAFDSARAHAMLDGLLTDPETIARRVLPALNTAASEWRDERGLAQVQFAARMLETRLLALGERWHEAPGPLALVGCGPGEQHTLGSIAFALALHGRGWRIAYLGADAPLVAYEAAARSLRPELVAICFTTSWTVGRTQRALEGLAAEQPLALAGPATHPRLAESAGARWLAGDPFEAAGQVRVSA
jgi:DNA-binding transcriptional MerR regulator